MEIILLYPKELEKHGLKESDLGQDAITGIKAIKNIMGGIAVAKTKGNTKPPSRDVIGKLKAFDKWVVREIQDHANATNKNTAVPIEEMKETVAEVKEQAAAAEQKPVEPQPVVTTEAAPVAEQTAAAEDPKPQTEVNSDSNKGFAIDKELGKLHEQGKETITLDELKKYAPTTYDVIFETYKEGEENGVDTTYYSLDEIEPKVFKVKKI